MRIPISVRAGVALGALALLAGAAFLTRDSWLPWLTPAEPAETSANETPPAEEPRMLKLSPQARKNLQLVSKPIRPQVYWRKIQVPGMVVDRPGISDRGVTSPAVGVVAEVHAFPGDLVSPGDRLLTLRLFSEYLQNTQKEFFSATREIQLIASELNRLRPLAARGGVGKTRIIELENQQRRQSAVLQAHRQDLLTRGLSPAQIDGVAKGQFVSRVEVVAPPTPKAGSPRSGAKRSASLQLPMPGPMPPAPTTLGEDGPSETGSVGYEIQELHAQLGQQVQAGQLLTTLSNHSLLYVEGHAFKREAPFLEQAAQNRWPITVEFAEDTPQNWPPLEQTFTIRYLSNAVDPRSRTFDFFIPLTNQARSYRNDNKPFVVWRFRPGQRVRLHVPVERMEDVFVLPSAAVAREGPEAFVFQQNGDLFKRLDVHLLHEDRLHVVIANDGKLSPGLYLAQGSASSLNRILKAQATSGTPPGFHVHADGTVHGAH